MTTASRIAAGAAVLLLSACAAAPLQRGPAVPAAAAESAQVRRERLLADQRDWNLQGRVAVSNGRTGGSGRLDWRQADRHYELALSAPITRQSWRLTGDGAEVRLDGLPGGPRAGTDATALLREATGWVVPVAALSSWARGARAPAAGPAAVEYAADGHLSRLEQDGWTIEYSGWKPHPGFATELPGRLVATRGEAKLRLVVDQWQPGPESP